MGMAEAIRLQYLEDLAFELNKIYIYDPETEYEEVTRGFFSNNIENTPENKPGGYEGNGNK